MGPRRKRIGRLTSFLAALLLVLAALGQPALASVDAPDIACCQNAPRGVLDDLPACRSFSADTEVLMADGSKKPISQIEVGDEVLAADPETGESGARVVVATIPHNDQLLTLRTSAGEIVTTEDHLYWNQTDSEWQESQLLGLGDRLLAADGDVVVVEGLDWSTVHIDAAYDLDVAGFDTFYVGAGDEAVLVHNIECPWQLKTDDIYGNQILGGDVHNFDSSVLRELTPSQLRDLQTDLTASIANRTDNLLNPSAAAGHNNTSQNWLDHADRLLDEKRLLTQVERMLG